MAISGSWIRSFLVGACLAALGLLPSPATALDAFTCYRGGTAPRTAKFPGVPIPPGVSLADAYGSSTVSVKPTSGLCAPTDPSGESPGAATHPEHLKRYPIKNPARPKPVFPSSVRVFDRFNPAGLDFVVRSQATLLVPAAKSLVAPPALPPSFTVDHFQCYGVKRAANSARFVPVPGFSIEDQFGTRRVDVRTPQHLCHAVDKNGEGVNDPLAHLLCYKVRPSYGYKFTKLTPVFVRDQFGEEALSVVRPEQLCVPASLGEIVVLPDVHGTYDYHDGSSALASIRVVGNDFLFLAEYQPGSYVSATLTPQPGGTLSGNGWQVSGGDVLVGQAAVSCEAEIVGGSVQVTGTIGINSSTRSFTMSRPGTGTPTSFGGPYVFTFDGLSNTTGDTTAELDLNVPASGFGATTAAAPEQDADDNVVGNFSAGECLVSPLGKLSCRLPYARTIPPPQSFPLSNFLAQIAGPLATGGTVYGDTPPIPHAFPAGSWTAARP